MWNNLKSKNIDEATTFYSSGEILIDYGSIYYYLKTKDNNKGKSKKF